MIVVTDRAANEQHQLKHQTKPITQNTPTNNGYGRDIHQ